MGQSAEYGGNAARHFGPFVSASLNQSPNVAEGRGKRTATEPGVWVGLEAFRFAPELALSALSSHSIICNIAASLSWPTSTFCDAGLWVRAIL